MKFIAFVLGLLLIASCATSSTTSSPVNIDGTWEGEYDSGMDGQPRMLFIFSFISDGQNLGGFIRNESIQGEGTPLENGKIRGNNISFTSRPKDTQMTFKYKGKIDGDKIKITYKAKMAGRPGIGNSSRAGRPMIDDEGRQIRSGSTLSMGRIGGPGMGMDSSLSGEFTVIRVK